jgi:hypothetical protein
MVTLVRTQPRLGASSTSFDPKDVGKGVLFNGVSNSLVRKNEVVNAFLSALV